MVKTGRLNNCGRAKRYVPRLPALLESLESRLLLSTTDPVIFNITGAVTPGQILGIEGGNFGSNAQVWIDRITDSSDTPGTFSTMAANLISCGSSPQTVPARPAALLAPDPRTR